MLKARLLLGLLTSIVLAGQVFAITEDAVYQDPTAQEVTSSAVPESTVAIALGGVLWFLLLRRRA